MLKISLSTLYLQKMAVKVTMMTCDVIQIATVIRERNAKVLMVKNNVSYHVTQIMTVKVEKNVSVLMARNSVKKKKVLIYNFIVKFICTL